MDYDFGDWVFPEKMEDFTRDDILVMQLKYGDEVEDELWAENTFTDE